MKTSKTFGIMFSLVVALAAANSQAEIMLIDGFDPPGSKYRIDPPNDNCLGSWITVDTITQNTNIAVIIKLDAASSLKIPLTKGSDIEFHIPFIYPSEAETFQVVTETAWKMSVPCSFTLEPGFDYAIGSPCYTMIVCEFKKTDSSYDAFDQGGNLFEWNKIALGSYRGRLGGY